MIDWLSRTKMLIGNELIDKLINSKVAVFGVGGVGSFTAEALARAGIGQIALIDYDTIDISNINRQIHALNSTIGKYKVDVMKDRILDINPEANIEVYKIKYNKETSSEIHIYKYDYVVDAIDMVSSKLELIENCIELNVPIISSMGTGNKLHPTQFEITDIYNTSVCPLAKVMRKELRKRGIDKLKVLYSKELSIKPNNEFNIESTKNSPASISFVPSVAGLLIAAEVVNSLIEKYK